MDNPITDSVHERDQLAAGSSCAPSRAENNVRRALHEQRVSHYANRYSSVTDPRKNGSTWTNVKPEIDVLDRHELFLLADGERKVEMETVTRKFRQIYITALHGDI